MTKRSAGLWADPTDPGLVDPALYSAVYEGIYGDPSATGAQALTVSCLSGNCSWPSVTSLGLCYNCANISHKISHFGNYSALCSEDPSQYDPSLCGPRVPSSENPYGVNAPLYQLYTIMSQNRSIDFSELPLFVSSFIILEIPTGYDPSTSLFQTPESWQVWATECALRYCYQTYYITSIAGITNRYLLNLSQEIVPSYDLQALGQLSTNNTAQALSSIISGTIFAGLDSTNVLVDRLFTVNDPVKMAANISAALSIWTITSQAVPAIGTVWLSRSAST